MEYLSARRIASWLSANFREYLLDIKDNPRPQLEDRRSDWSQSNILHASKVAACPKKTALYDAGHPQEEPDSFGLLRMEEGTSMGRVFAQYMTWLQAKHNANQPETPLVIDHESPLRYEDVTGSVDVLAQHDGEYYPVECKLTAAWKYEGVTLEMVAQVAVYIRLVRLQNKPCDTGYIFTMYDDRMAGVSWRIWIVRYMSNTNVYELIDDQDKRIQIPQLKAPLLSDDMLRDWINRHRLWRKKVRSGEDLSNQTPFLDPSESWECATIVDAELRDRQWTDPKTKVIHPPGSIKFGTGLIRVKCQFFAACWGDWLLSRGIDPYVALPRTLQMDVTRIEGAKDGA
jgi:hypothetical protein